MTTPDSTAVRRGRRQLVALAALFFVPLAIAFWLYYGPTDWRPDGGSNKGTPMARSAVPAASTSSIRSATC